MKPIDIWLEKMIMDSIKEKGQEGKKNPIMIGNFAPISNEQSYKCTNVVSGKVP